MPGGPALAGLEDKFRPHFFGGVATVVAKLLLSRAGLRAVRREGLPAAQGRHRDGARSRHAVKIVGLPTVREKDGLALSSRNVYLSACRARDRADALSRCSRSAPRHLKAGQPIVDVLARAAPRSSTPRFAVDYLEARHAETLGAVASLKDGPVRLLVAAKIGRTRLIDNIGV